jgi:hypothetical protein
LTDPKKKHFKNTKKNVVSSLKMRSANNASNKQTLLFYTFENERNILFLVCKILNHFAMQPKILFEGNAKQNAKNFANMVSFILWKATVTKINNYQNKTKCLKTWVLVRQDSFLENFKGKGSRERITNNQVVFVFYVTKRNEMQMRMQFFFFFYEQREVGKEEERKQVKNHRSTTIKLETDPSSSQLTFQLT